MPTTRRQQAIQEGRINPDEEEKKPQTKTKPTSKGKRAHIGKGSLKNKNGLPKEEAADVKDENSVVGEKRNSKQADSSLEKKAEQPPAKKPKTGTESVYQTAWPHLLFYRPKVQHEEAHSIDDVKNFHMLLVPRPPSFAAEESSQNKGSTTRTKQEEAEDTETTVLQPGADAVPAPELPGKKKHYRLITIGKKKLPDPESGGKGHGPKETFWASVTAVGGSLESLEKDMKEKTYETKTRGTRHEEATRLVARGGYALVNKEASVPSERETHLGYHVSHPGPSALGNVQTSLGIYTASSFVVQVKNPLAPTSKQQPHVKPIKYPEWIMRGVFGQGGKRGKEDYGLRFASCETPELLDYEGAQLLLIAAKDGEEGLETTLGDGRGIALKDVEEKEGFQTVNDVFKELGLDIEVFPVEPLEGEWI